MVVQGLGRGGSHCTSGKHPNADEWKHLPKRFGNWKTEGSEKQPGVRHIKADVTSERKQETNERRRWKKQVSWLRWDRVWTKAKSAEWLASVLEMDRDKKKTSIRRQPSSMMKEVES